MGKYPCFLGAPRILLFVAQSIRFGRYRHDARARGSRRRPRAIARRARPDWVDGALQSGTSERLCPPVSVSMDGVCLLPVMVTPSSSVEVLRDRKFESPEAANSRVKAICHVFKFGLRKKYADRKIQCGEELVRPAATKWLSFARFSYNKRMRRRAETSC